MRDSEIERVLEEIADAREEEFDWTNRWTWGELLETVAESAGEDAMEDVAEHMKEGGPLYEHRKYAREKYDVGKTVRPSAA